MREARKHLFQERDTIAADPKCKFIPVPGSVRNKQNTRVHGPEEIRQATPSPLFNEVDTNDHEEMEKYWEELFGSENGDSDVVGTDHDMHMGGSIFEQVGSNVEVNDEPDDYDIEMAKAEEMGLFGEESKPALQTSSLPLSNSVEREEPERQTKRKRERATSPDSPPFDLPPDLDHNEKRRPPAKQWKVSPVNKALRDGQTSPMKRKREPEISSQIPALDLSGDVDHDEKRRKSETGETLQPPVQTEKEEEEEPAIVTIPRTANRSDRSAIRKRLRDDFGYGKKEDYKPARPSWKFRSFFETRRLRADLLRKNVASWDSKGFAFFQSGKEMAEPGEGLGVELVAKILLDVRDASSRFKRIYLLTICPGQ